MLYIGWASCDLTPDQPVLVTGQFHARVSEGVLDPITATALALESSPENGNRERIVMVSCDLVAVPDGLRSAIREHLKTLLPELPLENLIMNATHTHTAPEIRVEADIQRLGGIAGWVGVDLEVQSPADYVAFAARRIAETVAQAWTARQPGGIAYGLGQAVVGHNRRSSYYSGVSRMYGNTNDPDFSHIEGYEDHSVNILATWDAERRLTGLVVNVPCPSQISEHLFQLSADYWHDTRVELRRRLGDHLFVLPQCSAAGDQSPHLQWQKRAEERMMQLMGRTPRQEIATRIADAVSMVLPVIERDIAWDPALAHTTETVPLTRRLLTEADVQQANADAASSHERYETLRKELEEKPELREQPHWYVGITAAYRMARWNGMVAERYMRQASEPKLPVEAHVIRLGDVTFATSPFEYYLDFGVQIKARSAAVQTFVIQLSGSGTYCPTLRAIAGQSYGAVPASTPVGPEGGHELVEWAVAAIDGLWA